MIKGFTLRLIKNHPLDEILAVLLRARSDGGDGVAIVLSEYVSITPGTSYACFPPKESGVSTLIWRDTGKEDKAHPYANTPDIRLVELVCHMAEWLGFRVMLKPHIDSYDAAWRYWIQWDRVAWRTQAAYRAFLLPYVEIARRLHNDPILCIGCELGDITLSKNVYLGAAFWVRMSKWARQQAYHGALTYAANWGQEANALTELWPLLDYVGVDAYWPLVPQDSPPSPDYETLLHGWDVQPYSWALSPADDMFAIARAAGNPLMFTEIGLSNYTEAAKNPGADAPQNAVRDDQLQADYYRAFRTHFPLTPYFCWEMKLQPVEEISHSIVNKPAEQIAFK